MPGESERTKEAYLRSLEAQVASFYRERLPDYRRRTSRHRYYYERQHKILRHLFPRPGRVLEVGCGFGHNLDALGPEYGLGIDCVEEVIDEARRRYPREEYPHLEFRQMSALDCQELDTTFDTIILVNSLTELPDPALFFTRLRTVCTPRTRVFQISYNYLWEPLLDLATWLGMREGHPEQSWLSKVDFESLFKLAGFEVISEGADLLMPVGIPLVSNFVNRFAPMLPFAGGLCMLHYSVARPVGVGSAPDSYSATVVVPCKNEENNVPGMVDRIPEMGAGTETIFVDDCSTDGTAEAILGEIKAHPERNVKLAQGPGQGKGAAVRAGLAEATGDVLMILDADLTVMPEALPEFMEAITSGKGEFINGSRLVYPIENDAMRALNMYGNKLFALLFSFILSQRLKDTLCGTKAMWRADYAKVLETRTAFGSVDQWGDYDWLFGAARHNLRIIELPVHYRMREAGETKMTKRLRNALVMLKMCGRAFWRLRMI